MRKLPLLALLVASLALAGCALPGRDNGARAEPALSAPAAACMRIDLQASPTPMREGQSLVVMANLTNVCEERIQLQSRNGCERAGLDLAIQQGTSLWRYRGPDASESRACPSGRGEVVTLQPGESTNTTWVWNGAFSDGGCIPANGHGCGAGYPAPKGAYTLVVTVMGKPGATRAIELA